MIGYTGTWTTTDARSSWVSTAPPWSGFSVTSDPQSSVGRKRPVNPLHLTGGPEGRTPTHPRGRTEGFHSESYGGSPRKTEVGEPVGDWASRSQVPGRRGPGTVTVVGLVNGPNPTVRNTVGSPEVDADEDYRGPSRGTEGSQGPPNE